MSLRSVTPGGRSAVYAVALPAILLVLFLVDSAVAGIAGWMPGRSRVETAVVAAAIVLALALACVALLPAARRRFTPRSGAVLATQVSLLAALAVGEGALGLLGDRVSRAPFHGHPRGLREVFTPRLAGTSAVAHFSVNSLGLRGSEPPADRQIHRILALGGSTTEDVYLDDSATWTRLLMDELNAKGRRRFWVASAGRSGFATIEHLVFVEESELLEEFDSVVLLVGINDLARMVWGEPADRVARPAAPLWSRLRLVELVKTAASRWVAPGNVVMDRNALFVQDARQARHQASVIDGEVPAESYLAAYGKRLEAIISVCRRRGLTPIVADQPSLFRSTLTVEEEQRLWLLRRRDGTYLPPRTMRRLMDRFNEVTRTTATRLGAPIVRLSALDGRSDVFYDDCHFSERGAREVATLLAAAVDWQTVPQRSSQLAARAAAEDPGGGR